MLFLWGRKTIIIARTLLVLTLLCSSSLSNASSHVELHYRAFELSIQGELTDHIIGAYALADGVFIHLEELLAATELQVTPSEDATVWRGWYFHLGENFTLDLNQQTVMVRGKTQPLPPESVRLFDDGLYIREDELAAWFGIDLAVDQRRLTISVSSAEKFARQLRDERDRQKRTARQQLEKVPKDVYYLDDEYRSFTLPALDLNLTASVVESASGTLATTQSQLTTNFDALYHNVYFTRSDNKTHPGSLYSSERLTISRYAERANQGEFLGATAYSVGDVRLTGDGVAVQNGSGRGIYIERAIRRQQPAASQLEIVGDGTPGWEAHLYRFGVPIAFSTVDEDGRYQFDVEDIRVNNNEFEVHLFGFYGERIIKLHSLWAGRSELDPGEFNWHVSLGDQTRSFLDGETDYADRATNAAMLSIGSLVGLTKSTRVGLNWSRIDSSLQARNPRSEQEYTALTLEQDIGPGFLELKQFEQSSAGSALQAKYSGAYRGMSYRLESLRFNGLIGAINRNEHDLDSLLRVSLSKSQILRLDSVSLQLEEKKFSERPSQRKYTLSTSKRLGRTGLSHRLYFRDLGYAAADSWEGQLRLNTGWSRASGSLSVDYAQQSDQMSWRYAEARLRLGYGRRGTLETTVRKQLSDAHDWRTDVSYAYSGEGWSARSGLSYSDLSGWQTNASVRFSIDYDTHNRVVRRLSRSTSNSGQANLAFYRDQNGNGHRDEGEDYVPYRENQSVLYERDPREAKLINTMTVPSNNDYRIRTNRFTFTDADYMIRFDELAIYTHAGSDNMHEIPLVFAGEITGYISGLVHLLAEYPTVELLDVNGELLQETKTLIDGFYMFEKIAPGEYIVRTSLTTELGLDQEFAVHVLIEPDIGYAEVNIDLKSDKGIVDLKNDKGIADIGWQYPLLAKDSLL